jgi:methionyl aminopeptidase
MAAGLFSKGANKMYSKTNEEVELIRSSCLLVSRTLAHVASLLKPGVNGKFLDQQAEQFIRDHKAKPAFKGYNGFPATLCISPNEVVVHGFPQSREFKSGEIVSIDCGVEMNGYFGDAAFTFAIGEIAPETMALLEVTYGSLYKGIEKAIAGNRVGDIGHAIQHYCERQHGYGVVRDLVGHGIGRRLHEPPDVPNFGKQGNGPLLADGHTIAIEPMVNRGRKDVVQYQDGWTIATRDGKPAAHYEHTVVVRQGKAEILSDHSFLLEEIKKNDFLLDISPKS